MTYASGDCCEGVWKEGRLSGECKFTSAIGKVYGGEIKTIKYPNSDEYNGFVNENGRKHGWGTMTYSRKCQHLIFFFKFDCTCTEATYTHNKLHLLKFYYLKQKFVTVGV
jgi:hypothetical protein